MDSFDPEVLKKVCSRNSNTDPLLIREAEVKDFTDFNEPETSAVTLRNSNYPSRTIIIPKLEETDHVVLNKENENPHSLDKDSNNSENDNLIKVIKVVNKFEMKSDHLTTQSRKDESFNNKSEDNLKDVIEDNIGEKSDPNFDISNLKQKIFCSTPVTSKEVFSRQHTHSDTTTDFGQMSPLDIIHIKNRMNLKRKSFDLECIQEEDEYSSGACIEKKVKLSENAEIPIDQNISVSDIEPPAKSLLKKQQPSCLSQNSNSTYIILDECSESNLEVCTEPTQDIVEPTATDDFDGACKSLTEELIKSSTIESLDKYDYKEQLEIKIDDKFDEELQESKFINEKTSLFKPKEEAEHSITGTTLLIKKIDDLITETDRLINEPLIDISEDKKAVFKVENPNSSNNIPAEASSSAGRSIENVNIKTTAAPVSIEKIQSENSKTNKVDLSDINNAKHSDQSSDPKEMSILYADGKDMTMDEEDFLLEEDLNVEKKPYVFFEFVSSDPKENEDNYNPEWQKLGRLTSDEERFKAVRDRWRSLVPPDPNKDLTFRQWREKNRKPPLNLPSLNNNHQMHDDNEKNQLCTAVFDVKINEIYHDFDVSRDKILQMKDMNLKDLEHDQEIEKSRLRMRGGNSLDIEMLHKHHLEEQRQLKNRFDQKVQRIKNLADGKARIFKDASKEVLLFQQFYKGVGASDEVCLYLTDIQVQELMETEEMLEQYTSFYN